MAQQQRRTVSIADEVEVHDPPAVQAAPEGRRSSVEKKSFKDTWKLPPRYEVRTLLGQGAYGCVCEARDLEKKRKVAIKQARHLMDDLIDAKRILREIAILTKLDHPHIVRCYDVVAPANLTAFNEIYVVLEIADSDLKKLLRAPVFLSHMHVHSLLYNLVVGLNYLHSAGIWHRDLKPANCLVNEDCMVKICDFGLARAVGGECPSVDEADNVEKRHLTGHVVTRWYRAPELILLQANYSEAVDTWSVACIFAELLGMLEGQKYEDRAPLFPGHSCFPLSPHAGHKNDTSYYTKGTRDQLSMICKLLGTPSEEDIKALNGEDAQTYMKCFGRKTGSGVKSIFGAMDPVGCDLLEKMLMFNPSKRISVAEAVKHKVFDEVRDKKVETLAKAKISLHFEQEQELDERHLRSLFLQEVRRFHPEVPEMH